MPEPCKSPLLDSCQKRFLWSHREIDLASHPVVCLVLQVEDGEKFSQERGFESLDLFSSFSPPPPFSQSQQAGSMFHSRRGGRR